MRLLCVPTESRPIRDTRQSRHIHTPIRNSFENYRRRFWREEKKPMPDVSLQCGSTEKEELRQREGEQDRGRRREREREGVGRDIKIERGENERER